MEADDRALVRGLRARERASFDELYRRHHQRIWAFLVRLSGSRQEAEDMFQETWLAAARHAHELDPDGSPLCWLYAVARNKHRNARRWRLFDALRRAHAAAEPPEPAQLPDEIAAARDRVAALAAAFPRLSDAHREVLLLCLVEGMETAAVARILGLRAEAVRQRLCRARAELARLLGRNDARPDALPGGLP
ncbi:MAG: sigma-70 family RNA polymerase sigma factor [Deltaproteobacteria bacterium]|nr:sigma-70 family RNA polymerase sigma factor [Deltaproteobacteria bacterium]